MAIGVYMELATTFRGALAGEDLWGQDIAIGGLRTGCNTSLKDLSAVSGSTHQADGLDEALEAKESASWLR
jgi:hypothetical protein